jgi:hypothetical protein
MRIKIAVFVALALVLNSKPAWSQKHPETPHLVFVTEFIRELSAVENIREKGEKENIENPDTPFPNMIHTSTLFQLELGSESRMLKGMHLSGPFDEIVQSIAGFYDEKVKLWMRYSQIAKTFVAGPVDGVDYQKLAAELPELRGRLEYLDQSIFQATPAVFASLINEKEDSHGHASHLIITNAERTALIDRLNTSFGTKLDQKIQNYTVSSASVLRDYLKKDFKCSDDPWD